MVDQAQKEYLIFGIGNPLLDISVETPTDEILKKYELIAGQAILAGEKQMPIYDELWNMEGTERIPGGSALNTMRATAVSAICLKRIVDAQGNPPQQGHLPGIGWKGRNR